MLYSGPPCTQLQGDPAGRLSVPQAVHRYCVQQRTDYQAVPPATLARSDFERVHHPAHVHEVLTAAAAAPQASAFMSTARFAIESCGIHFAAARAALKSGFVLALAGDFGAAGYGSARPACLLNGLLVTAARLRDEGLVERVLIIDGNGQRSTAMLSAMNDLELNWIEYLSLAGDDVEKNADVACERVEAALLAFSGELVMYQCGTDCCGAFSPVSYMSQLHWQERHRRLSAALRHSGARCVMNVGAWDWRPNGCILTERALLHF